MRRILFMLLVGCHGSTAFDYIRPPLGNDGRTGMGVLGDRFAAALSTTYKKQVEHAPPISLVPSDGSELALVALDAQVVIDGPVAHTELHLRFHNPERRIREGRFSITVPPDAAVDRFAMLVNGAWRESRVVARAKARQVYESFLHKRVDPALLEQDAGNTFSARIFPIPAESDKELILAYDHLVSAAHPYELGLAGLPAVPHLAIAIDHDGAHRELALDGKPPVDLDIAIAPDEVAATGGGAFIARLDADRPASNAGLDRVVVLVDTSASRAPLMGRQADVLVELARRLPPEAELVVAAYDQDVAELYRGRADGYDGSGALFARGALGASDLGAALAWARTTGLPRIVLVGDGTPTLGEVEPAKLARRVAGAARVDAIQIGTSIDRDTLSAVLKAGRATGGIYDGRDVARVVDRLASAPVPDEAIAVEGATAQLPKRTAGLAPGEPLWVFGRAGDEMLAVHVGGLEHVIVARSGDPARVARLVARAQLAALTDELNAAPEAKQAAIGDQIEQLALAHHLVSARTSLLVLETDADEQRMLGPDPGAPPPPSLAEPIAKGEARGEVIMIRDTAPTIDRTSTTQGITIDRNYLRNIPVPGRTFEAALGAAAGSQTDGLGTTFSGSSSLENQYYVDGVNTTGLSFGHRGIAMPHERLHGIDGFGGFDGLYGSPEPSNGDKAVTDQPYTGVMRETMRAIASHDIARAVEIAAAAEIRTPGDVSAILALGEALEARGATGLAARAYGSLIDLYPSRAELIRTAGERLDRVGARALAMDAYRRAKHERPDQLGAYRMLAYDLVRAGDLDGALDTIVAAKPLARRASIQQILTDDARLIATAIAKRHPERRAALAARFGQLSTAPSLRIVLGWETDANDVDLHVVDRHGDEAWYSHRELGSGGMLLDDVTDGYGPEMFVADKPDAFPYRVGVHYFARGPEGLGLGVVQIIRATDGELFVEDRPFAIQADGAKIDLGVVAAR